MKRCAKSVGIIKQAIVFEGETKKGLEECSLFFHVMRYGRYKLKPNRDVVGKSKLTGNTTVKLAVLLYIF